MKRKGQNSLEFITIFAIGLSMTLILGSLFFIISKSEKSNLDIDQISRIGNQILDLSEEVYFRGTGNKVQYKAVFPGNINSLEIMQLNGTLANYSELRFSIISENGNIQNISFIPKETYVILNCSTSCNYNSSTETGWFNKSYYSLGPKTLSIRSIGDQVLIDFIR